MLVLSRHPGEQILIGDGIVVTLLKVEVNTVRIGVEAPKDVSIYRREAFDAIKRNEASNDH